MDAMKPPPVPVKRKAVPLDEPKAKRLEPPGAFLHKRPPARLGDELPDEVSREDIQSMLDKADAARMRRCSSKKKLRSCTSAPERSTSPILLRS